MVVVAAPAARITQRDSFHRVQCLNTGRYLRFRKSTVELTSRELATWFPSYTLAVDTVSRRLGACAVEIERHDR